MTRLFIEQPGYTGSVKKHKNTHRQIFVHVVTFGTFWGSLKNTWNQFNTILSDPNLVNDVTNVISVIRPSNTVHAGQYTYIWPVAVLAVLIPTRLCCTRTVQSPGQGAHKSDIPILLCVSGVFLGSASSINITSPCVARPTTLRTAFAAMSQVTCLLPLSWTLCHQYIAILEHLVSVHDKISGIWISMFVNWKTYPTFNSLKVLVTRMCLYM